MRSPGKIDYLGEDVLGRKKGRGSFPDGPPSQFMCHLEGAFPHDLRRFSACAGKWFGVSSDNESEIINDSRRESVNHVNFFRNKISYA